MRTFTTRVLLVVAVACLTISVLHARQQGAPQRGGQAPAAPVGPLAPEKYKDIKVLTDLPADQLDVTMRYFVAATGIRCEGCHVRDQATGVFSYEQDTRTKTTARTMINLVKTVNAGDMGVRVNCAICHAGQNRPPGLQLAQMMTPEQIATLAARQGGAGPAGGAGGPGGAPGAAPGAAGRGQQPPLPAVDEILNKYVEAIGGSAALAKIQSRVMTGTVTTRGAQSMAFTIEEKGAKYLESTSTTPDALQRGFDGTVAWIRSGSSSSTELTGFMLQQVQRNASLTLPAQLKEQYQNLAAARAAAIPATTPGGTPTQVTALRGNTAPNVLETLLFDATSGLLLRRTVRTTTGLNGALNEQFDYGDYRVVNGVKMPFEIKRTNWNTLDTLKVTDIKTNVSLDDARFARPR